MCLYLHWGLFKGFHKGGCEYLENSDVETNIGGVNSVSGEKLQDFEIIWCQADPLYQVSNCLHLFIFFIYLFTDRFIYLSSVPCKAQVATVETVESDIFQI